MLLPQHALVNAAASMTTARARRHCRRAGLRCWRLGRTAPSGIRGC